MIKKYKKTLIASSLALLIPVIVGLLLWDKLPDPMPSHWNIHGEVDSWSSKAFMVFGIPALMLVLQWGCWPIAIAMQVEGMVKMPLCQWRYRSGKWIHDVTRVND